MKREECKKKRLVLLRTLTMQNEANEQYTLTQEEFVIITFSIFAAYPRLYWEDNQIWNNVWFECQKAMIEQKQESIR